MKIACKTLFDCSVTGVTGHFRPSQIPFTDRAGQWVDTPEAWHRSRNQQRNWETLLQVIGLRTQPDITQYPVHQDNAWNFEFSTDAEGVYGLDNNADPLAGLIQGCAGVPMVTNLCEQVSVKSVLCVNGNDQNIWFNTINT
jgi:hypothetical protein